MKHWTRYAIATSLVLATVGGARADMITQWTYSWDTNPLSVAANGGAMTGGINLTALPLAAGATMTGDSNIPAVNLSTFSAAPTGMFDTFNKAPYALLFRLTDTTSGQSGNLTFNGQFDGTLSTTSAQIGNTFLSPGTQTLVLGQHTYTVALNSYVAPGLPSATVFGSIGAHVSIDGVTSPPPPPPTPSGGGTGVGVSDAPEPSTLLLAGLTLPAGLVWWRARRGKAAGAC
jgi:hypothetical protein